MRKINTKIFKGIIKLMSVVLLFIFTDLDTTSMKTNTFSYNLLDIYEMAIIQGGGSSSAGPCDSKPATICDPGCTILEIGVCRNSSGYCTHDTAQPACRCAPGEYRWTMGCARN